MKVSITGGAGFVDLHLAEKLLKVGMKSGFSIICLRAFSKLFANNNGEIEFVKGDRKNHQDALAH